MMVRMAAIKKSTNNKFRTGCGDKGTLLHCWWECKLVQLLWRTVWRFLKKLQIELLYDPAIPLMGIHTEKSRTERDTCTSMFIPIHNRQDMEATQMSIGRQINKKAVVHIHNGILLSYKKKVSSNEFIIQSEGNQKEKHQSSILMHIYGIQKDSNDDLCETYVVIRETAKETQI